jgi:hypothetical protein
MNSATLATNLLGRPVRLRERPVGLDSDTGRTAMIYIDSGGLHYVLLVAGRLVQVDRPEQFEVLDDAQER